MRTIKWGLGVAGLVITGVLAFAVVGVPASAQTPPGDTEERGQRYSELLAEELGIGVDELNAARLAARNRLIDEAVAAGDITAERGETLKALELGEGKRFAFGKHMAGHGIGRAFLSVVGTAADIVGLPLEDLRDRLQDGETLLDIAAGQGMTEDELKAELTTALTDKISQAVADGNIRQEMADRLLEHLDELIERAINAEGPIGPMGRPFGEGFERFRGGEPFNQN